MCIIKYVTFFHVTDTGVAKFGRSLVRTGLDHAQDTFYE